MILLCTSMGRIGELNQLSIRKILAFASIIQWLAVIGAHKAHNLLYLLGNRKCPVSGDTRFWFVWSKQKVFFKFGGNWVPSVVFMDHWSRPVSLCLSLRFDMFVRNSLASYSIPLMLKHVQKCKFYNLNR